MRRRAGYRTAFLNFDIDAVAGFEPSDIERVLREGEIIRNRQKVVSTVENARRILDLQREHGSFDSYLWSFVPNGQPSVSRPRTVGDMPSETDASRALSKALKAKGISL